VRFVQAYAAQGILMHFVTPQNEPLFEPWECPATRWDAAEEALFIGGFLGPALENAGMSLEILSYDHNWDHPE
jgi:glucosylceramidase